MVDAGADAALDDGTPVYGYPRPDPMLRPYMTCRSSSCPVRGAERDFAQRGADRRADGGARPDQRAEATAPRRPSWCAPAQRPRPLRSADRPHPGRDVVGHGQPGEPRPSPPRRREHHRPRPADWPEQVHDLANSGAEKVLATVAPSLDGATAPARDGALHRHAGHADLPDAQRVPLRSGTDRRRTVPHSSTWAHRSTTSHSPSWSSAVSSGTTPRRRRRWSTARQGRPVLVVDEDLSAALEV